MAALQKKVRTCFWFDGKGREAAELYVSLLPDSRIDQIFAAHDEEPLVVEFTLAGAPMMILNGGPMYSQTEAASISVLTDHQQETDTLWKSLIAHGGTEGRCGWLKDRYGVSWQIVPKRMIELINHADQAGAIRAREAMMKMGKINSRALELAFGEDEAATQ